jgi:hypothetical protein
LNAASNCRRTRFLAMYTSVLNQNQVRLGVHQSGSGPRSPLKARARRMIVTLCLYAVLHVIDAQDLRRWNSIVV